MTNRHVHGKFSQDTEATISVDHYEPINFIRDFICGHVKKVRSNLYSSGYSTTGMQGTDKKISRTLP